MATNIDASAMDSTENQINLIGPGSRLRLAREKANLSITDVAMRLHLRNQLITAIENDDYHSAPQFVFIRGYLRAYANLLHIPPQEVIEAFDSLNIDESPTDRPVWRLSKKQVTSKDRPMRWATFFIILCLITLVGIWWHSQKNNLQNKLKADKQQIVTPYLDSTPEPRASVDDLLNSVKPESLGSLDDINVPEAMSESKNDDNKLLAKVKKSLNQTQTKKKTTQ